VIPARAIALPLFAALAALSLTACGKGAEQTKAEATGAPDAKPGLTLTDGKLVLPAVKGNPAAAYFTLDNQGKDTASIAALTIAGVGKAEMHQTMGGEMKPVDRIDVEPKTSIKFEPGKLHVMAFELDGKLKAGETTELTVTFTDGDKLSAPLTIEAAGAAAGGMEHMR
jgi:periplasmic copper chaperone A